jgi:L-seryl-tRNA(Ser) seleniumtransferase
MERRSFVKWLAALPLMAQVGLQEALGTGWAETAKLSTDNVYTRIGVRPVINGRGTWTYLSASLELPEVKAAQDAASKHFVNIF